MGLCFQFTHFPRDDWENIHLSYYHNQIGSMNYYSLFRVRSWNNGMHCMSLYILLMCISKYCCYFTNARQNYIIKSPYIVPIHSAIRHNHHSEMSGGQCPIFELCHCYVSHVLTLKHRETHWCIVSTVATDALALEHQAISNLSVD